MLVDVLPILDTTQSSDSCYKEHLIIMHACRFFSSLYRDFSSIHLMVGETFIADTNAFSVSIT